MPQQPANGVAIRLAGLLLAGCLLAACGDDDRAGRQDACADPAAATWSVMRDPVTRAPFRWSQGSCVGLAVARGGSKTVAEADLTTAVGEVAAAWTSVTCTTLCLTVEEPAPPESFGYDPGTTRQQSLLVWVGSETDWRARHSEAAIAITSVVTEVGTGSILDADIELNDWSGFDWSLDGGPGKADVQSLVAHELGHLLGLGHDADPDALMWGQWDPGWMRRAPTASDRAAICTLYACPERLEEVRPN